MEEATTGKITKKFAIKMVLLFILIDIVIGFIWLMMKASGMSDTNDVEEMGDALNSLVTGLIVVNIIAAIVPTLLATKSVEKKYTINSENNKAVFKNIAIVLVVFAIVVGLAHAGIKNAIFSIATEDSDLSMDEIKEAREDIDEYVDEHDLSDDDQEMLEIFDSFMGLTSVYTFDCIAFLVMIPVEYYLLIKKKE